MDRALSASIETSRARLLHLATGIAGLTITGIVLELALSPVLLPGDDAQLISFTAALRHLHWGFALGLSVPVALLLSATRARLPAKRRCAFALAAALIPIVVLGVGVEIAMRTIPALRARPLYTTDPVLVHRLIPGTDRTVTHRVPPQRRVHLRINQQGFRGPELVEKSDLKRVLLYGDSFIEAQFSPLAETYGEQLRRRLSRRTGSDVELINAGVGAYGPDQIAIRMETELDSLEPDLVVIAVYAGNDYGDLLRNKIFSLGDDGVLHKNPYRLSPDLIRRFDQAKSGRWPLRTQLALRQLRRGLGAWLRGEQSTPEVPPEMLAQWLGQCLEEYASVRLRSDFTVVNILGDHPDFDMSLTPASESARYKRRLMRAVVGRMKDMLDQRQIPAVLVVIPSPIDARDNYEIRIDLGAYPEYDRRAQTQPLIDIGGELGLAVVDLFPRLHDSREAVYFGHGDAHWNARGQRLAAEMTTEVIVANHLLGL